MSEVKNVPEIRFAEFTNAWEQRKLGDVGKARSGVGFPDSEQGGTTGTPFFKVSDMNLDGNGNEMTAANNYVTAAQIAAHRWSPIEELPAIFFAKVGAAVMLNRKRLCRFPFLLDNNTMAYSLNNTKWNADFAKALFETVDLTSLVQVGALPSYNAGDIEAMEILLPSLSEQSQIGAFFKKIDNLIILHQRKLDRLVILKQAILEKMFPQNGSDVPEVRFDGFTDPWEQRKFGDDLISIQTGTNKLGSENGKGTPLLKMGNIQRGYFSLDKIEYLSDGDDVEPENIAYYGDFFFNTRNTLELVGKGATWTGNSGEYAFNSNIARFKLRELDTIFFNYLYNTRSMIEQVHARAMGTTSVAAIYPQSLKSIEYYVPTMAEQQRIGELLLKIDNLITLHHRKHESLKHIKAALLQKMFV